MEAACDQSQGMPAARLMSDGGARRLFAFTLLFMALGQLVLLCKIGNGISRFDIFDEADAVRAAEAFAKKGFSSHHGLAHLLYGDRFPNAGAVTDHLDATGNIKPQFLVGYPERLRDRNEWVYLHYPPGTALWNGVQARVFGCERIWLWRLAPIGLAFLALTILYRTLARAFGADRSALITLACAILPMTNTFMPCLYYESYSQVFLLLQLSVIIGGLWGDGLRRRRLFALFLLGFLQGWLSFDFFFLVSLAVVPLWLLRRAEGSLPSGWGLCLGMGFPLFGFGLAHCLHLVQIAEELGGFRQAISELAQTAVDRAGVTGDIQHFSYSRSFVRMSYLYVREFLRLYNPHFGPFLPLAMVLAAVAASFRKTELNLWAFRKESRWILRLQWPGPAKLWPALVAGFATCVLWPVAMPGANVGNFHIYPRDFFLFYFILVVGVIRSLSVTREPEERDR